MNRGTNDSVRIDFWLSDSNNMMTIPINRYTVNRSYDLCPTSSESRKRTFAHQAYHVCRPIILCFETLQHTENNTRLPDLFIRATVVKPGSLWPINPRTSFISDLTRQFQLIRTLRARRRLWWRRRRRSDADSPEFSVPGEYVYFGMVHDVLQRVQLPFVLYFG